MPRDGSYWAISTHNSHFPNFKLISFDWFLWVSFHFYRFNEQNRRFVFDPRKSEFINLGSIVERAAKLLRGVRTPILLAKRTLSSLYRGLEVKSDTDKCSLVIQQMYNNIPYGYFSRESKKAVFWLRYLDYTLQSSWPCLILILPWINFTNTSWRKWHSFHSWASNW